MNIQYLLVLLFACAAGGMTYVLAGEPFRKPLARARMSIAARKGMHAKPTQRMKIAEAIDRAGEAFEKVIPPKLSESRELQNKLDLAGLKIIPSTWRAISLGITIFTAIMLAGAALVGGYGISMALLVGIIGAVGGWAVCGIWLSHAGKKRGEEIDRYLPPALELLTISVSAGVLVERGFRQLAENKALGPLADEFARTDMEISHLGVSRVDALDHMRRRCDSPLSVVSAEEGRVRVRPPAVRILPACSGVTSSVTVLYPSEEPLPELKLPSRAAMRTESAMTVNPSPPREPSLGWMTLTLSFTRSMPPMPDWASTEMVTASMPSPIAAARDSGLSLPAVDALVSWEPLAMYWVATRPTGVLEESSISFLVIAPSATVLFGTETKARSLAEISSPAWMVFVAATTSVVPENASAIRLLASISDTTATPPARTAMTARPAVTFCRRETFTAIFSMPVRLGALGDVAPRRPAGDTDSRQGRAGRRPDAARMPMQPGHMQADHRGRGAAL